MNSRLSIFIFVFEFVLKDQIQIAELAPQIFRVPHSVSIRVPRGG
jgi:hypothetical protein